MKKFLAEIIAGLIPHKMTRNRWRGILRYGLRNAYRLKREIKNNHSQPKHYLSVCVIAKNEGPYFKEWLEWHISMGVDKFYVYDNDSTDETREILKPYIEKGIVDYTPFPGYRRQLAAYDDCFQRHRFDTRWLAIIDMDEFIVPEKDASIPEFLHRFEDSPVVEINWLIYGSGGQRHRRPGTMMERFLLHSRPEHPLNHHVKSIVDPRRVYGMIGCHEAARIDGKSVDSHGNRIRIAWRDREPIHDVIKVNHYAVRSYEEFAEKQLRGRASGRAREVKEEYFTRFDLNDIDDSNPDGIPAPLDSEASPLVIMIDDLESDLSKAVAEWAMEKNTLNRPGENVEDEKHVEHEERVERVVLVDHSINGNNPTVPLTHIALLSSGSDNDNLINTLSSRGVPVAYNPNLNVSDTIKEMQALGAAFPVSSRDSLIRLFNRFYNDRVALAQASAFALSLHP